jgi:putative methionine-R-sulfoxide reductase with GAF domain
MSVEVAALLLLNALAFMITLGVFLLVFWRSWRTNTGEAMLQFLGSLAFFQGGTFLTHFSVTVGFPRYLIEDFSNITLAGFALIAFTTLALLLHAAEMMKDAWVLVCRAGLTGLLVLQPALWQYGFLHLPSAPDHSLFDSPYTTTGEVAGVIFLGYIGLGLFVAARYWRQINAPLLVGPVIAIDIIQITAVAIPPLREYPVVAICAGMSSGILGYHLLQQYELSPRSIQIAWLQTLHDLSQTMTHSETLSEAMNQFAEHARYLIQTDTIGIMAITEPDQLKLVAMAGNGQHAVGRQIQIGEGLSGRVMQTLQPMRIDNYRAWDGRASTFEDMPFYATMSIPLIHNGELVGIINAAETHPGRVFTEQDQVILELLAPLIAITIAKTRLEEELVEARYDFEVIASNTASAVMIFNAAGNLRHANAQAEQYLQIVLGIHSPIPTLADVAAHSPNPALASTLKNWGEHPSGLCTFEVSHPDLGNFNARLYPLESGLMILWAAMHD